MQQHLYLTQFNLLETEAENILALFQKRFGFPHAPPVPVKMIAQALFGLRCELRKLGRLGTRTVGALSKDDSTIYVDKRCNQHQYVFAVAHEIGHWVLHEGNHCSQLFVDATGSLPLNRILGSARARSKRGKARLREIEANQFAAALLIPRSFLSSHTTSYEVIDAAATRELARAFWVSMEVMLYRVKHLSKHLAWAGPRMDWGSLNRLESVLNRPSHPEKQATYREPLTARSGKEATIPPNPPEQTGRKASSARKSKAVEAIDFLIRFADTQPGGELLSTLAIDSHEVYPWQSSYGTFTACPAGQRRDPLNAARIVGDYLRTQGKEQINRGGTPLVVELAGTPNAGKDTLIELIKDYLGDVHNYKVRFVDESVRASCHIDRELDIDRLWKTVALTVVQLYEARLENPGNYDIVILNRGLVDRLALLHASRSAGRISETQERVHADYLVSYAHLQDIVFLLLIPPEESLRREMQAKRKFVNELAERDGVAVGSQRMHNQEMLSILNSSYLHAFRAYRELFDRKVHLLDWANWDGPDALNKSIMAKASGMIDVIVPTDSAQLPFPELFGFHCLTALSSAGQGDVPHRRTSRKPRELAAQLSFV